LTVLTNKDLKSSIKLKNLLAVYGNMRQVSIKTGVSPATVAYWADKHGIRRPRSPKGKVPKRVKKALASSSYLRYELVDKKQSTWQVARELGVSFNVVVAAAKKAGVSSTRQRLTIGDVYSDAIEVDPNRLGYQCDVHMSIYQDLISSRFFWLGIQDGKYRRRYLEEAQCSCGMKRLATAPMNTFHCGRADHFA
jgi:hypothetical protein